MRAMQVLNIWKTISQPILRQPSALASQHGGNFKLGRIPQFLYTDAKRVQIDDSNVAQALLLLLLLLLLLVLLAAAVVAAAVAAAVAAVAAAAITFYNHSRGWCRRAKATS